MAITLSTGVTLSIAASYDADDTVTAITNATDAVCTTSASHGIAVGDYVEVTSGWDLLDGRVVRAGTGTTGSTLVLEDVDTSNTTLYPIGAGIGSVRRVASWTQLSQLKSISSSGGTQNFADITSLSNQTEKRMPTTRSAVEMTVDVYDDPALTWFATVRSADESKTPYAMLMAFGNGSKLVGNAYWGIGSVPSINQNEALVTQLSLSYAAQPIRYAS